MSDRRSVAFAALTLVWLLGLELLGVEAALAYLAPALLILVPLLGGRYPGDEALVRVAGRRSSPTLRRPSSSRPRRRPAGALMPRGGRLVGAALAGRAPPAGRASRRHRFKTNKEQTMRGIKTRVAAATGVLTLALAGTAGAHITANPGEAASDSFATLDFSVGHGCEESPTTQVRIQIPPSVPSVTPGVHPLWDVATKEGKKDKVELHGETITRGVSEVTYTAKQALPPDRLDLLTMSVKLPAGKEGESVYFPTIQRCEKGQNRWIQIPAEGESPDELEEPAPAVVLTAAEGGHGGGASAEDGAQSSAQPAASVQAAAVGDDDEGAPVWLAITALVVGALGLIAGIGGLMAGRRRTT
jgi:periplasmic copper chaperone A